MYNVHVLLNLTINILTEGPIYPIWNEYCLVVQQWKDDSFIFHVSRIHVKCELNERWKKNEISVRFFILHHHSNRQKVRPFERGSMLCDVCVHRLYTIKSLITIKIIYFSCYIQWFSFLNEFSALFFSPNFIPAPSIKIILKRRKWSIISITRINQQWSEWTNERRREIYEKKMSSGAYKRYKKNERN